MLRDVRTVIVDEIHAVAGNKRGSHLALTTERLEALVCEGRPEHRLLRIGLSATQKPIVDVARYLVGTGHLDEHGRPDCVIVNTVGDREMDLDIEMPPSPLEALMAGEVWDEVYDRLAEMIGEHKTTLLFVNTRRLAERLAHNLTCRLGDDAVTSHHGSLSKEQRLDAETRLKNGELKALVATASLELGIDIGAIDLVGLVTRLWTDSGDASGQLVLTLRFGKSPSGTTSTGRLAQAAHASRASAQYTIAMATGRRTEKSMSQRMNSVILERRIRCRVGQGVRPATL